MDEILITPDTCMQFLIWSYYYHGIMPTKDTDYRSYGTFSDHDGIRLNEIKDAMFRCFEETSVRNACKQFQIAKERHESCPFTQHTLDNLFAKEVQK